MFLKSMSKFVARIARRAIISSFYIEFVSSQLEKIDSFYGKMKMKGFFYLKSGWHFLLYPGILDTRKVQYFRGMKAWLQKFILCDFQDFILFAILVLCANSTYIDALNTCQDSGKLYSEIKFPSRKEFLRTFCSFNLVLKSSEMPFSLFRNLISPVMVNDFAS